VTPRSDLRTARHWGGGSQAGRRNDISDQNGPFSGPENEPCLVGLCRAIGSACVVALIVLSLLPAADRPDTGFAGQNEHVVAYFGTAAFLALGFRTMRDRLATVSLLVALAAVLELIQRSIPGRHSQLIDLAASSSGAILGVFAVVLMARLLRTFVE
jgi:VanZ family protein